MRITLAAAFVLLAATTSHGQLPTFIISVDSAERTNGFIEVIVRAENKTAFDQSAIKVQCRALDETGDVLDLTEFILRTVPKGQTVFKKALLRGPDAVNTVSCSEIR